jgi:hypothetical protein
MRTSIRIVVMAAALAAAGTALAADFAESPAAAPVGQCIAGHPVVLTGESNAELKSQVAGLMDEAIGVAESPAAIGSRRPVFLWASETKVACGKAYGYLRAGHQDAEYLYKCECFHARMVSYMN